MRPFFFFSSRRRHTRCSRDWSSDVCSSDLWKCELSRIPFETTAQADPREGFIGQERALRALKMGVELSAPGYNVFVCGLAGTSRGGTIARMIRELHPRTKESLDRCYLNNFKFPDRPPLLTPPRRQAAWNFRRNNRLTTPWSAD